MDTTVYYHLFVTIKKTSLWPLIKVVFICLSMCLYIYIYIERERERKKERPICSNTVAQIVDCTVYMIR